MTSKPRRYPWTKWYPEKFLNGIIGLTVDEIAVYTVVLNLIMDRGDAVVLNAKVIAARCGGMRVDRFNRVLEGLIEAGKLTRNDSTIDNEFLNNGRTMGQQWTNNGQTMENPVNDYLPTNETSSNPLLSKNINENNTGVANESLKPDKTPEAEKLKNAKNDALEYRIKKEEVESKNKNLTTNPVSSSDGGGKALVERLVGIAGDAFRDDAAYLNDISPITALIDNGADLETDIIPVVREFGRRASRDLGTWKPVAMAIADRLKTKTATKPFDHSAMGDEEWARCVEGFQKSCAAAKAKGLNTIPAFAWSDKLGPRPGEKGCRVPFPILEKTGFSTTQQLESANV